MRAGFRAAAVAPWLLAGWAVAPLGAQAGPGPAADSARPVATAFPLAGAVALDGRLDEAAWAAAAPAGGFIQQRPNEGAAPGGATEVRFLYDAHALYIGARMHDTTGVTSRLARRDQSPQSDLLRIDLDPYHDRLHSVEFDVNPAGWRGDAANGDRSWDPVWAVATQVDSAGWTAEIRIPFSQLHFSRDPVQTWGLNVTRLVHRTQERSQWSFWRRNEPGGPAFYGELRGLRFQAQPRHLEVAPYVVGRLQRLSSGDRASPFHAPRTADTRVGADLKYQMASSLTLSATVNPDFGQVEVDPEVVNLSDFETFYPEQRPFFVEGSGVFRFGAPGCNIGCDGGLNLFYSRRIGRQPQGGALATRLGPYSEVPENTAILGALKLTGRAGGYRLGVLNAVTGREVARVFTPDSAYLRQAVEPLTSSSVARVQREMRGGNLVVGAIGTSVDRSLGSDGLADLLPRTARTAGVDAEYAWGRRTYRLYAAVAASDVRGDSAAILRLQRSSARYLQRPDLQGAPGGLFTRGYDPSATRMGGYAAVARVAKEGGDWLWDLGARAISPGFETNDLGYGPTADVRWLNGTVGRQWTRPTSLYRTLSVMGGGMRQWNHDGTATARHLSGYTTVEFLNFWTATLFGSHEFATLSDRLTRGGPLVRQASRTTQLLDVASDPRRKLTLGGTLALGQTGDGGRSFQLDLSGTLRPAPNVSLTVGPGFSRGTATDQYVGSLADSTAGAFLGRRYVFSHLAQTQLYLSARANVTFRPDLSLEMYVQPLLASADYRRFGEFAAPRSGRRLFYGEDVGTVEEFTEDGARRLRIDPDGEGPARAFATRDPDFNLRSLRGTGVLRWEWRSGSTLFLVWTQTRSGTAPVGDFHFGRDRAALFGEPADNIFMLKMSYWLGR